MEAPRGTLNDPKVSAPYHLPQVILTHNMYYMSYVLIKLVEATRGTLNDPKVSTPYHRPLVILTHYMYDLSYVFIKLMEAP